MFTTKVIAFPASFSAFEAYLHEKFGPCPPYIRIDSRETEWIIIVAMLYKCFYSELVTSTNCIGIRAANRFAESSQVLLLKALHKKLPISTLQIHFIDTCMDHVQFIHISYSRLKKRGLINSPLHR